MLQRYKIQEDPCELLLLHEGIRKEPRCSFTVLPVIIPEQAFQLFILLMDGFPEQQITDDACCDHDP